MVRGSSELLDQAMRLLIACLLALLCSQLVLAEPVPVTIWQKEKRIRPEPGDTVRLQRSPFTFVFQLKQDEHVGLVAGVGSPPEKLQAFEPGHGMAGPYDGLLLTWDAFHYFNTEKSPNDLPPRLLLWDRRNDLYYWQPATVYDNTHRPAKEIQWKDVPDFKVIIRKDGFEDTAFEIEWVD